MRDGENVEIDRGTVKRWLRIVLESKSWPCAVDPQFIFEMQALLKPAPCPYWVEGKKCILGAGHHRFMSPHPKCCDDAESDPVHRGDDHRLDPAHWKRHT